MRVFFVLLGLALTGCGAAPEPCDSLCEGAGFENIEETEAGCFCSGSSGFGAEISAEACEDYCTGLGHAAGDATVSTSAETNDTCSCGSGS